MGAVKRIAWVLFSIFVGYFLVGFPATVLVRIFLLDEPASPALDGLILLVCTIGTVALMNWPRKPKVSAPAR